MQPAADVAPTTIVQEVLNHFKSTQRPEKRVSGCDRCVDPGDLGDTFILYLVLGGFRGRDEYFLGGSVNSSHGPPNLRNFFGMIL